MSKKQGQFTNVCITIFRDKPTWGPSKELLNQLKYIIWAWEKCPQTKKIHCHIYAEFKSRKRLTQIKTLLGIEDAHIEKRHGTRQEAINYVKKEDCRLDGTVVNEWGQRENIKKCEKSSLEEAVKLLKETNIEVVAEELPTIFARHSRGLQDLDRLLRRKCEKEKRFIDVVILWGDAGTGKSVMAKEYAKKRRMLWWELSPNSGSENALWMDGYNGEECLIINDFEGKMIKHRTMLDMLDFGVRSWQVKGKTGGVQGEWTTVIITSNYDPQTWYKTLWEKYPASFNAFFRRINKIYRVEGTSPENAIWEIQKDDPPRIFIQDFKLRQIWKNNKEPEETKRAREEQEAMEQEDINTLNGQEKELEGHLPIPVIEDHNMEAESWADPESEILSDVDWTRGPDGTWIDKKFMNDWMEKEKERLGHYPEVGLKTTSPDTQDIKEMSIEKIIDRLRPQMAEEKRAFMERRQAMLRAEAGKKIEDAPPIEQVLPSLLEKASESELERLMLPSPIPEEEEEDEREDTEKTERRRGYIWKGKTFDMDLLEEWLDEQEMRLGNFSSPSIPWKRSPSIQPDGSPCIPWKKSPSFEGAEGEDTE